MSKEVFGALMLGGEEYILPLGEAHKIQTIMARHAEKIGHVWRTTSSGGNISYLVDVDVPTVVVKDMPALSAKGLDWKQIGEWREAVAESWDNNYLSPQDFLKLKGEQA